MKLEVFALSDDPHAYLREVLDHGEVTFIDCMGDDRSIVNAARVSYNSNGTPEEDAKLIKYLLKNRHTSPFEHVVFTFKVKAPLFVLRQWQRHRTWSFNEVSARYTKLPNDFYTPEEGHVGSQHSSNKQMRALGEARDTELYYRTCSAAFDVYDTLLKEGWPRELARGVLPVSTYSEMYATVDLHNLLHFLELRLHDHTQYEIRVYAEQILELLKDFVPITLKAWNELRV